ncbi:MAG: MBG domain-containing protein [Campylobacterota bacterium]
MNRLIDFSSRFRILKGGKISLVVSALLGSVTLSFAAPSGGTVTSGTATINQSGNVININQSSQKASINWQNFSIARNETVNFNQPNVNSITLNRVIGNEKSVIDGALNANGQVWILNSNGVLFGKNASINTSGILATTAQLSDADFNAGNYNFKNSTSASIINQGAITVVNTGSVVLASNEVRNSGTIKAVKGKVYLIGADSYSLNLNGNSLVNLKVNKGVLDALVKNSGTILADGGEIYLTTNAVNELLKGVVNNTGIIEANSLDGITGKVELFAHGGTAEISGNINALDGFVETSGKEFKVADDFKIKAKEWLLDPTDITVEATGSTTDLTSNSIKASFIESTLNGGTGVTLQADNNIYVNEDIAWNKSILFLRATSGNVNINSTLTASGTAGLSVTKGGNFNVSGKVNFTGTNNYLSIDGYTYTIIKSLADLQNMNNNLTLKYALGIDIDASATSTWNVGDHDGDINTAQVAMGWNPIGDNSTVFTGSFDGLGHTINNLYINRQIYKPIGLFGYTASPTISNIGLTNVNITGGNYATGALVGLNQSSLISNAYSTGNITGYMYIGGLIGVNGGTINNSYSSVNVTAHHLVGGLVGMNSDHGSIINSYATGSVTATGTGNAGGLVGKMKTNSTITNSYSVGKITNNSTGSGGLVGIFDTGDFGTTSYANLSDKSIISNSFYNSTINSTGMGDSDLGKTTEELKTPSTFAAWGVAGSGGEYPTFDYTTSSLWKVGPLTTNIYLRLITGSSIYGDTPTFTYAYYDAATGGSAITDANPSGTITWSNILTSTSNVGTYGLTYSSGITLGNSAYALVAGDSVNWIINPKVIDLSVSKTYDGNANFTSGFTLDSTDIVNSDSVGISGSASVSSANANTYTSFDSSTLALDNSNYTLSGNTISAVINKANATVTANSDTVTYNGQAQSVNGFSASGLVNGETISVLNGVTASATGTNAGAYTSSLSGTDENYNLTFVDGSLVINKANATVTANSNSVTYNGSTQNVNGFTATGLVGDETESVLTGISGATASGKNAGEYTTTLTGTDGNYNLTFVDGSLTITPKQITVSADELEKILGSNDPLLTYIAKGIIGEDVLEGLLSRDSGETVGEYKISKGTLANPNYAITFNDGVLTIKRDKLEDIITPVVNNIVVPQTPKIEINRTVVAPQAQPVVMASTGQTVNLLSQPTLNQNTTMVTIGELRTEQNLDTPNASSDIRVPVGDNSIIELVNGGVNLPNGLEQQFFVVANETN